jgi:hypothetical protein
VFINHQFCLKLLILNNSIQTFLSIQQLFVVLPLQLSFLKMKFYLLILLILAPCLNLVAQESEEHDISNETEEHEHPFKHHHLGILTSHSHLSQGVVDEGVKWKLVPSWIIFYEYKFNEKWGVGIHIDWIAEDFEVERHLSGESDEIILRERPIAPAVMGSFKATNHSTFAVGMGVEYASGEAFALTRIGYEWSTHMGSNWEFVTSLNYDIRWDAYDVWSLGVGVIRLF